MNKMVSLAEVGAQFVSAFPTLTKKAKLLRFAAVVRAYKHDLYIFSCLEEHTKQERATLSHPQSAFAIAAADPELRDAGLKSGTVGSAEEFFDLTVSELHSFSCNCGGGIENAEMARRIESIANAA